MHTEELKERLKEAKKDAKKHILDILAIKTPEGEFEFDVGVFVTANPSIIKSVKFTEGGELMFFVKGYCKIEDVGEFFDEWVVAQQFDVNMMVAVLGKLEKHFE